MMRMVACLALLASMPLQAATSKELLAGHEEYFKKGKLENGVVSAQATEAYGELGSIKRAAQVKELMLELSETMDGPLLLRVDEGIGGTLWALPEGAKQPAVFESWDKTETLDLALSPTGRWFSYLGVGIALGVPKTFDSMNLGINYGVKVGTFLWKDILDLGVNLGGNANFGFSAYSQDNNLGYNLGLFTRAHFPIVGPLGGHVGCEGAYNAISNYSYSSGLGYGSKSSSTSSDSSSTEGAWLAGISIFLPMGSLDFDARFAVVNTYNVGITVILGGPAAPGVEPAAKPLSAAKKREAERKALDAEKARLATERDKPLAK